ncbi:MAG: lipid-A-disaccharide synthase [Gammaproteobacteria bacterium]|nr:lipid-A-disaccharide synthase [Gammaproteobacteria bacterium]
MKPLRIGLVAGETSGDRLGAALIDALQKRVPELEVIGVAGDAMRAAGCRPIADISALSVMGLTEIVGSLPRLLRLRHRLVRELAGAAPDLVVGIDAPEFNLGLERALRARGVRTAHYVSPSVWAWRPGRVHTVARAAKAVLCLLPFEPACYDSVPVHAVFTGHPLADELAPQGREAARAALDLPQEGRVLAVLPGSRSAEVERLAVRFLDAARELARGRDDLRVIVPAANASLKARLEELCAQRPDAPMKVIEERAHEAIVASDVVLAASGTVTLEAMLLDRPMVVAYRMARLSAWLLLRAGLLRAPHFSLPNLLAGREIVPELAQQNASVATIIAETAHLLDDTGARAAQCDQFAALRSQLGKDAAGRAAEALLELLDAQAGGRADESGH